MRFSALAPLALLPLTLVLAPACDTSNPPPRQTTTSSSSSSSGVGGEGGEGGQGGAGGEGGLGGQGGTAGQGGSGGQTIPYCGDGNVDQGEQCDDGNPGGTDLCSADCKLIDSEVEPNNTTAQANAWVSPWGAQISPAGDVDVVSFEVASKASVVVETRDVGDASCLSLALDTVVEILSADGSTVLASDDDSGEGYCSRAVGKALAPGSYFARIVASSEAPSKTFAYRLALSFLTDTCGDNIVTPAEQCDDGNLNAGDGCSPSCQLEIKEVEPNDTTAAASAYAEPFFGVLSPLADVDVVSFSVASAGMKITAQTTDGGLGTCASQNLDTVLEILAPDGSTVLGSNDDTVGFCSYVVAFATASGTHFARVKAGSAAKDPSLYGLSLIVTTP